MARFVGASIALTLLLLVGACAGRSGERPFGGEDAEEVTLEVTNNNFQDATLWALSSGERRRLGIVTGKSQASYQIPWRFSQDMRLEIDLLAGERCTTRALRVDPGDVLEVIIDVELQRSPLCA